MRMHLLRGFALAAAALLAASGTADAAGFAIFEQGARGMGFAGAFTAQANDPSAIFHNPAGIAFLKGKQIYVGGTGVRPTTDFVGADPFPGATTTESGNVGVLPVPAFYYSQPFTDRLAFGLGVHTPFGLKTAWADPNSFTGRFISQEASLSGVSINPTVAYKLADRLSIGAGLDVRLSKISLQRRVPVVNPFTQRVVDAAQVDLDSDMATGLGFNLGLLGKLNEEWSVGVAYRHKVTVDYGGDGVFRQVPTGNAALDARAAALLPAGAVPVQTAITFPSFGSVGLAYRPSEAWAFEADANWYQWSSFDSLTLDFARDELDSVIEEEYEDALQFRVGAERRLSDAWYVRGGYFFDQSPSPAASVSPLLPDADRHGFSLGGSWVGRTLRVDAATWYVTSPDRSTEGVNRDRYDGTYSSRALTFGLSLGYTF
jgi:long-chain fatty acid transport protein